MTDRPILFSAPMVRALLDGRKTQTRRIIKAQPWSKDGDTVDITKAIAGRYMAGADGRHYYQFDHPRGGPLTAYLARFAVGDRLWVKESWRDEHPVAIQQGRYSQPGRAGIPGPPGVSYRTIYRADGEPLQAWRRADGCHPYFTLDGPADEIAAKHPTVCSTFDRADGRGAFWNSSRYMPRWASRLTLTVTDVRVQRLREISEADCIAEGAHLASPRHGDHGQSFVHRKPEEPWQKMTPRAWYHELWNAINGAGSWDANPWVVALTFIVERRNIDEAKP